MHANACGKTRPDKANQNKACYAVMALATNMVSTPVSSTTCMLAQPNGARVGDEHVHPASGAVEPLVALLASSEAACQEASAWALCRLAWASSGVRDEVCPLAARHNLCSAMQCDALSLQLP